MIVAKMEFNETALSYPQFLFCGSFNPIHEGHLSIVDYVYKEYKVPVDFEISLNNVEKSPITIDEVKQRALLMINKKRPSFGKLYVSNDARYLEKARYLPGVTFVCGFDTFNAFCEGKYYENFEEALDEFETLGSKWLVFPRGDKGYRDDYKSFPERIMKNTTIISPLEFSFILFGGENPYGETASLCRERSEAE